MINIKVRGNARAGRNLCGADRTRKGKHMTREVEVTITGVQKYADHEDNDLRTRANGEYYYRNGSHYILYEEHSEGFTETTKSMLKLKDGVLEMTRKGLINTNMVFEKDKETVSRYKTPFGEMQLRIRTKDLCVIETEDVIRAKVAYDLEAEGRHMAECVIEVLVNS